VKRSVAGRPGSSDLEAASCDRVRGRTRCGGAAQRAAGSQTPSATALPSRSQTGHECSRPGVSHGPGRHTACISISAGPFSAPRMPPSRLSRSSGDSGGNSAPSRPTLSRGRQWRVERKSGCPTVRVRSSPGGFGWVRATRASCELSFPPFPCKIILEESSETLDWTILTSPMPDFLFTMVCDTRFTHLLYGQLTRLHQDIVCLFYLTCGDSWLSISAKVLVKV
jgi:hypothetical protein